MALPDFLVAGVTKAERQHCTRRCPVIRACSCRRSGNRSSSSPTGPPPASGGPGDALTYREHVWQRDRLQEPFQPTRPRRRRAAGEHPAELVASPDDGRDGAVGQRLLRVRGGVFAGDIGDHPGLGSEEGLRQRRALLPAFEDDIRLLERVLGEDFGDWLAPRTRSGGLVGARPAGQGQAKNGRRR